MTALHVPHEEARAAYLAASWTLTSVLRSLSDDDLLAASPCRGWTVCELVVHAHLGLQEMLIGLVSPTDEPPDSDAALYWQQDLPTNDEAADAVAGVQFVRRVGAAYRRPIGAVGHLLPTVAGVERAVRALPEGTLEFQERRLTTGELPGDLDG